MFVCREICSVVAVTAEIIVDIVVRCTNASLSRFCIFSALNMSKIHQDLSRTGRLFSEYHTVFGISVRGDTNILYLNVSELS